MVQAQRWRAGATLLAAVVLALLGLAAGADPDAELRTVCVFANPSYVDTTPGQEVQNLLSVLRSFEGDYLATVQTFAGTDFATWQTQTLSCHIVVVPELEKGDLGAVLSTGNDVNDPATHPFSVLAGWVASGGAFLVMGSAWGTRYDVELLNRVFGIGVSPGPFTCFQQIFPLPTEEVDGSFLAGGPEVLSGLSCTASLLSDDLPAGTRSFYQALGGSFVASIPSGSGFIGYIGWDFFGTPIDLASLEAVAWKEVLFGMLNELDVRPVFVNSVVPAPGTFGVSIFTTVVGTFSEPVDPVSFGTSFFLQKESSGLLVPGNVVFSDSDRVFEFTPDDPLDSLAVYRIKIFEGLMGKRSNTMVENFDEMFVTEDTVAPFVVATTPTQGATGVPRISQVTIEFSEPINVGSAISAFSMQIDSTAQVLAGSFAFASTEDSLRFTPSTPLPSRELIIVGLEAGVLRDNNNIALDNDFVLTFVSEDYKPPSVVGVLPDASTGVSVAVTISIAFDEPMDRVTTANAFLMTFQDEAGATVEVAGTFFFASVSGEDDALMSFVPTDLLHDLTTYTVVLDTTATDVEGNALDLGTTFVFETQDLTAPIVTATSPSQTEIDVALDASIEVTFSEPIDVSAFAAVANAFTLSPSGDTVPQDGSAAWFDGNTRLVWTPAADLASETSYTFTLNQAVTDLAGNRLAIPYVSVFATIDATAPFVVSTNLAASFPLAGPVTVTFDGPMAASSTQAAFSVTDGTGTEATGSLDWDAAFTVLTFVPAPDFEADALYTLTVGTGASDLAGNAMEAPYVESFETVDTINPGILSVSPSDGETNVALGAIVTITFTEAMNEAATGQTGAVSLRLAGSPVAVNYLWSPDSVTLTMVPVGNTLLSQAIYTILVTTAAVDEAGVPLEASFSATFTTEDKTAPQIGSSDGMGGSAVVPVNGATLVPLDTTVRITFSELMDQASVETAFTLVLDTAPGAPVAGSFSWDGVTVTFTPNADLDDEAGYTIGLATTAADVSGNTFLAPVSSSFSTADITPPSIGSFSPTDGQISVDLTTTIEFIWTEAMDAASVESSFHLRRGVSSVELFGTFSWFDDNTRMVFTPNTLLNPDLLHTITIDAGATDANGVAAVPHSSSFTSLDVEGAEVEMVSPVDQASNVALTGVDLVITFNEAMDTASAASALTVTPTPANTPTITFESDDTILRYRLTGGEGWLPDTTYTVYVATSALDAAGNALVTDFTSAFSTRGAIDTTAPIVADVLPATLRTRVDVNTAVVITFSESMDIVETMAAFSFSDSDAGATIAWSEEDSVLTYTPSAPLAELTTYTVTITTQARDSLKGSDAQNNMESVFTSSFTTTKITPPTVVSIDPANGEIGVAETPTIVVTFDEVMEPVATAAAITVDDGNFAVPGTLTWTDAPTNTELTFVSSIPLPSETTFFVTISTGATDDYGNAMAAEFNSLFTIEDTIPPEVDVTPPIVVTSTPVNGATGVAFDATIEFHFSEPMDEASLLASFSIVPPTAAPGTATVLSGGTLLRYTLAAGDAFEPSTVYTAAVNRLASDQAGNQLDDTVGTSFTIRPPIDTTPPYIVSVEPAPGSVDVPLLARIIVVWSEPMDVVATSDAFSFTGETSGDRLTWNADTTIMTYTPDPATPYAPLTTLTVTVADTAADVVPATDTPNTFEDGPFSWSFTTADGTAPSVVFALTSPGANAVGVSVETLIRVTFSEGMETSSLDSAFSLVRADTGAPISGSVAYSNGDTRLSFDPAANLESETSYEIVVAATATDKAGTPTGVEFRSVFTTRDVIAPVVVDVSPADRADDVSVYATVVVAFNEAMDLASTQADFSLLDGAGVPVDGVFLPSSSNSVIFRPSSALAGQTEHTIQILTGAADASGNAIAAPVVTTFSTELVVAPTVVIGSLDGRTDVPVDVAIGMSFSETMDRASVEAAWTLSFVDGGAVVAGTWTWVTDSTFATFTPAGDLPDQTEFNAVLTTAALDEAGNPLVAGFDVFFFTIDTTPPVVDTDAPSVVSVDPADNADDVASNAVVSVTFNEPMNVGTTTNAFSVSPPTGAMGVVSFDATFSILTYTLAAGDAWAEGTTYVVSVGSSATDAAFNALEADFSSAFRAATSGDTTPPTVVSTSPIPGAIGVALLAPVTIRFSEPMDVVVSSGSFLFTGSDMDGSLGWNADNTAMTYTPSAASPYATSTTYTVVISTQAQDKADPANTLASPYSFSFTTTGIDGAPYVVTESVIPADNAVGVDVNADVVIVFSEPMAPLLTGPAFELRAAISGATVAGTVAWTTGDTVLVFSPSSPLASEVTYVVEIDGSTAVDAGGEYMDGDYAAVFTTGDVSGPSVVSIAPADGATEAPVSTTVTVIFDEAMNTASARAAFFMEAVGAAPVSGVFLASATDTLIFRPSAVLASETDYMVTIDASIATDTAGNAMAGSDVTATFTTEDAQPPTALVDALDGAVDVRVDIGIAVSFSETMFTGSVEVSFSVEVAGDATDVAGSFAWNADDSAFVWTADENLMGQTLYTVELRTTARDIAGNEIETGFLISFTTVDTTPPDVDNTPPSVVSSSPAHAEVGVASDASIVVTFSEPMTVGATAAAFAVIPSTQAPGSITFNGDATVLTYTLAAGDAWVPDRAYTIVVTRAALDAAFNALDSTYEAVFLVASADDTTAPTVVSSVPSDGATGVALAAPIQVRFSEPMEATASILSMTVTPTPPGGSFEFNAPANTVLSFVPTLALVDQTTYTVSVTTSAVDLAGNNLASAFSFSFTTTDASAPAVVFSSVSPAPDADGVAVNAPVSLDFTEAMDEASVLAAFSLTETATGNTVTGTAALNGAGTGLAFVPSADLASETSYTIRVGGSASDLGGNAMGGDFSSTYTTADVNAPTVAAVSPADEAVDVLASATVSVVFSEDMDQASARAAFALLDGSGTEVAGTFAVSTLDTIIFRPDFLLASEVTYTVTVDTTAADAAGNAMGGAGFSSSFTTGDQINPSFFIADLDAQTGVPLGLDIVISFTETMNAASVEAAFSVAPAVDGTFVWNGDFSAVVFRPSALLTDETVYNVVLTTEARDEAGLPLTEGFDISFETVDITPPSVVSVVPNAGAMDVMVGSGVVLTFSEPMGDATLTQFFVSHENGVVDGTVAWQPGSDQTVVSFVPASNLASDVTFTVTVTQNARDRKGNNPLPAAFVSTFTTEDILPPVVTAVHPVQGAVEVNLDAPITVRFNEEIDVTNLPGDVFDVREAGSTTGLPLDSVTWSAFEGVPNSLLTAVPSGGLSSFTDYMVSVSTGVVDLAGNRLAVPFQSVFQTADVIPPEVTGVDPDIDAGEFAALDETIVVAFSESVVGSDADWTAAVTVVEFDRDGGEVGTVDVAAFLSGDASELGVILADPSAAWTSDTVYEIRIGAVTDTGSPSFGFVPADAAGNAMEPTSVTFVTIDIIPPVVINSYPIDGQTDFYIFDHIVIAFNEDIDTSSLEFSFAYASGVHDGLAVGGTFEWNDGDSVLTFNPDGDYLDFVTSFTFTVGAGTADNAGNTMGAPYTVTFVSGLPPDEFFTLPPTVTSPTSPGLINPLVDVVFDLPEAAAPGSVQICLAQYNAEGEETFLVTLDLAASFEAAGVHSLALDVNNFGGSTGVVSVSVEAGNGILAHDQVYTFVVKYQDVALNPPAEDLRLVLFDAVAPTVSLSSPNTNPTIEPVVVFLAYDEVIDGVSEDDIWISSGTLVSLEMVSEDDTSSLWQLVVEDPATGIFTIEVTAVDDAGNVGNTASFDVVYGFCSDDENGLTGIFDVESGYCACLSGYTGETPTELHLCDNQISGFCFPGSAPPDVYIVENESDRPFVNPALSLFLKQGVKQNRVLRSIKIGGGGEGCEYPGPGFAKGWDAATCEDTFYAEVDFNNVAARCDVGVPEIIEVDPSVAQETLNQIVKDPSRQRRRLRDEGDDFVSEFIPTKWAVYTVVIETETYDNIEGFDWGFTWDLNAVYSQVMTVRIFVPTTFGISFGDLVISSDHGLDALVVAQRWNVAVENAPATATIDFETIVAWPYKVDTIFLAATPDDDIAGAVAPNGPGDCHDETVMDRGTKCTQEWRLTIVPTVLCSVDGSYRITVDLGCRNEDFAEVGACLPVADETIELINVDGTEICQVTFLDETNTVGGELRSFTDATYSQTGASFFLGQTAYFEVVVLSEVYPVERVDVDYAFSVNADAVNVFGDESLRPLDIVAITHPSNNVGRFSTYLSAAAFPAVPADGEPVAFQIVAAVSVKYNDGSRARRTSAVAETFPGLLSSRAVQDTTLLPSHLVLVGANGGDTGEDGSGDGNNGFGAALGDAAEAVANSVGTGGVVVIAVAVVAGIVVVGMVAARYVRRGGGPGTKMLAGQSSKDEFTYTSVYTYEYQGSSSTAATSTSASSTTAGGYYYSGTSSTAFYYAGSATSGASYPAGSTSSATGTDDMSSATA